MTFTKTRFEDWQEIQMAQEDKHLINEPDIGSGEKSAGQKDVEHDVQSINGTRGGGPLDGSRLHQAVEEQQYANQRPGAQEQQPRRRQEDSALPGRILQSGTHLARILAVRQDDGTYEAQVYVRLAREPQIAETYIPAGTFPNEADAWAAAENRANRAFKEHEF